MSQNLLCQDHGVSGIAETWQEEREVGGGEVDGQVAATRPVSCERVWRGDTTLT